MSWIDAKTRLELAASSDAETVMNNLQSRPEGHYNEEVTTCRIRFGDNEITDRNGHATLKRLYHSFANVFVIALAIIDILWPACAIIQGEEIDWAYVVILTSLILISGFMTFFQETRSSNAAAKLIKMVNTIILLRREGIEVQVDSADLVVGDIIILDAGDRVPADVRILKSNHLKVNQSMLTGESDAVLKTDAPEKRDNILECSNMAFMGSTVMSGSAEAIVVTVGDDTFIGTMAEKLSKKKEETKYDKGTKEVTKVLIKVMFIAIPAIFAIMLVKDYLNNGGFTFIGVRDSIIFAITLSIGLMPEMLTAIVSSNLAKGAVDMSKKQVIVKDTKAIQNFGAMDVLCSDKTGTLTHNRISVEGCKDLSDTHSDKIELLMCLNGYNLKSSTNQIDWAIQEYAEEKFILELLEDYTYVNDIPFDFFRRRATTVVRKDGTDEDLVISKGATPELLSFSTRYEDVNGDIVPITDEIRDQVMSAVEEYSKKGMRVIGIGYRTLKPGTYQPHDIEDDLTFLGFIVFTDPVKETARAAIANLRDYHITTKVLTGDNEYVAEYVGKKIGVKTDYMLTGPDIDRMSEEGLKVAVEKTDMFVRLTPDNKEAIVKALRANGHTVGVMGDGINDVLAMRAGDVSISVDTSIDIAKDTSSMILLEKDLGVLLNGAIEGRRVYANTIKYVKMIGSINFGWMISIILATLFFNFNPMGALMLMIFNMINDIVYLAIPWDNVDDEFLRYPRGWDAPNLNKVIYCYGPLCPVIDVLTWLFMIFVVFTGVTVSLDGFTGTMSQAILSGVDLSNTNYEVLFQTIWLVEQYWLQAWAIHVVRTNKIPFKESKSCRILIITTILVLIIGTVLPFSGGLWEAITGCTSLISVPLIAFVWMPVVAVLYFVGSHLIKRYMLRKYGFFAC